MCKLRRQRWGSSLQVGTDRRAGHPFCSECADLPRQRLERPVKQPCGRGESASLVDDRMGLRSAAGFPRSLGTQRPARLKILPRHRQKCHLKFLARVKSALETLTPIGAFIPKYIDCPLGLAHLGIATARFVLGRRRAAMIVASIDRVPPTSPRSPPPARRERAPDGRRAIPDRAANGNEFPVHLLVTRSRPDAMLRRTHPSRAVVARSALSGAPCVTSFGGTLPPARMEINL